MAMGDQELMATAPLSTTSAELQIYITVPQIQEQEHGNFRSPAFQGCPPLFSWSCRKETVVSKLHTSIQTNHPRAGLNLVLGVPAFWHPSSIHLSLPSSRDLTTAHVLPTAISQSLPVSSVLSTRGIYQMVCGNLALVLTVCPACVQDTDSGFIRIQCHFGLFQGFVTLFSSLRIGPVCVSAKPSKGNSQISGKICKQERFGGKQVIPFKVCWFYFWRTEV